LSSEVAARFSCRTTNDKVLAGRNTPQDVLLSTRSGRSISGFCTLARDFPEIHRRIRTPRPPGLGVLRQFARVLKRHGPQRAPIARRKRVGFPPSIFQSLEFLTPDSTKPRNPPLSKLIRPSHTARARARTISARAPVSPMRVSLASAKTSGVGNR
jgi:hypothetical protein